MGPRFQNIPKARGPQGCSPRLAPWRRSRALPSFPLPCPWTTRGMHGQGLGDKKERLLGDILANKSLFQAWCSRRGQNECCDLVLVREVQTIATSPTTTQSCYRCQAVRIVTEVDIPHFLISFSKYKKIFVNFYFSSCLCLCTNILPCTTAPPTLECTNDVHSGGGYRSAHSTHSWAPKPRQWFWQARYEMMESSYVTRRVLPACYYQYIHSMYPRILVNM